MQQISQTSQDRKILKKLDEDGIKKMDANEIAAHKAEKLQRCELQAKLKSQEKMVDYLERAKRIEEIPLLVAHLKKRELQDEEFRKQEEERKNRFLRMKPEKMIFLEKLLKYRNIVYKYELKEFKKLVVGEHKKRLDERWKLRIDKRHANYIRKGKKVDYLERAKRIEEIPLLEVYLKERELQDEEFWKQEEVKRIRDSIAEHELIVGHQSRWLYIIEPEKKIYLEKFKKDRKSQEKMVDYLERAKRKKEIPLIVAHLKNRELQDEKFWKQEEEKRIRDAITEHELTVGQSHLLHNIKLEKMIYLEKFKKGKNIHYEDKLKEFEKLLADERENRLGERRKQRIEERRAKSTSGGSTRFFMV